jgi:hypothetical protein
LRFLECERAVLAPENETPAALLVAEEDDVEEDEDEDEDDEDDEDDEEDEDDDEDEDEEVEVEETFLLLPLVNP